MAQAHFALGDSQHAQALLSEAFSKAAEMKLTMPLIACHLTRARFRRALEPDEGDAIREDLDAAERTAMQCSARSVLPEIHIERAELGGAADRRRELEAALALYSEMEARPNAARVEELLGK